MISVLNDALYIKSGKQNLLQYLFKYAITLLFLIVVSIYGCKKILNEARNLICSINLIK